MDDEIWQRDEIESPCIKICVIHEESGLCIGCHRSRDEISGWSGLTPENRRKVSAELPDRALLIRNHRRKRHRARD